MKLPTCDFGILFTALLAALTVAVTAPAQPSPSPNHPLVLLAAALHR